MLNVRLAGGHLYGKLLFGDVYDGVFLCSSFFPRDVLDKILDLIESVSEGFPTFTHIVYQTYRIKGKDKIC